MPQVYRNNPKSVESLNVAVKTAVRELPLSVCLAAVEATLRRAKMYIERNIGHIERVLGVSSFPLAPQLSMHAPFVPSRHLKKVWVVRLFVNALKIPSTLEWLTV